MWKSKKKTLLKLISPVLVGTVLFMSLRPALVQAANGQDEPTDYSTLRTGYNIDPDGYRQIKYKLNGKDKKITNDSTPHVDPDSDKEMIVWAALVGSRWQIFLYDAKTEKTTQLTTIGNNIHPAISGNVVVWEGFVDGVWHIFMFNGIKIIQITSGDNSSQDVGIEGDYIVFSQMTDDKEGRRIYYHQISSAETTLLTPYSFGADVKISNRIITWIFSNNGDPIQLSYSVDNIVSAEQVAGVQTSSSNLQLELINSFEEAESSESTSSVGLIIDQVPVSDESGEAVTTQDIEEELGITILIEELVLDESADETSEALDSIN